MEILNKEKLKAILERWRGHPSIAGLMEKFSQLQSYTNKNYKTLESYTKQKIKESKYELVEMPYIDVKEDPVRPELDLTFRQTYGRKVYGLKDDEGDIAAIVCFAFTDEVPKTVEEMETLSRDAALQATLRAGVQGSIAIAYTVWAKKKGGGRAIINEVYKMVKKSNHLNRLVTLSPLTKMARNFHIKNGAKELQVNEGSQNFEYDISLEEWETALVKAKRFLKIK
ncbi:MAG: hypothetical protein CBB97_06825 [Candidatus Endolissoclinum sp. TMED37]|nr:MAG: hypothetical protein CBB97_06825 [Candidatus Endolissoclinum sp. TMED37]|tara:strand:+ start:86 stop:763 length:678 start_codon:yes stop_codon:yes gene_type:complete